MTIEPSGRVRRSLRYHKFDLQGDFRVQEANMRRERITVSDRLKEERFQQARHTEGAVDRSPSGRIQVLSDKRPKMKLISAEGIRNDLARLIFMALGGLMAVILLVQFAAIGTSMNDIRKLDQKISAVEDKNAELQTQLEQATGDISIRTEAVKLNLISSYGAKTIILTAPEAARMVLVSENEASGEAEDPEAAGTAVPEMRAALAGNE